MKTPRPSDVDARDVSATAPRAVRLPREVLTAEQGFWTAARVPRVATPAGNDESRPSPRERRRDASLFTRALRQVVAFLFGLVIVIAVGSPARAATGVFLFTGSERPELQDAPRDATET